MKRNKLLLLIASLGSLALLVFASIEENFLREWRVLQRSAPAAGGLHLRQVVVPELRVADRCVSCHVGMAAGEPSEAGHPVLKPHPKLHHDAAELGCTTCHGGQGRATDKKDAHGDVHFWPEPMLPLRWAQAGCGSCHTHLEVPNLDNLRRGQRAFEQNDCLACHRLDGRGGTFRPTGGGMEGPDLSLVGARGYRPDWYEHHLSQRGEEGWQGMFGEIPPPERRSLEVLMRVSVGAPRLVEAKALFHSVGCRGCHKIDGVGGDDGPDLTRVGQKDPGRIDFSRVSGERSLTNYFVEHFKAPAQVVPGSQMPMLGLDDGEIELLTGYMLSLRRGSLPEAYWPRDRVRVQRFGEREFARDGATLYGTFCSACHGPRGEGMRYPGMSPLPAISSPDFLELAPDALIRATVEHGRPGRRMPAWKEAAGGLREGEIDALVTHVRELGGGLRQTADPRPRRWVRGDAREGRRAFEAHCAACHGVEGEGGEGPALANRILLGHATDTFLFETIGRGRRGTSMGGYGRPSSVRPTLSDDEIESIVTFLREKEGES